MRLTSYSSKNIGQRTVEYNMQALDNLKATFGMSGRMGLLLYPTLMLVRDRKEPKILIVGPRTEDDIFWAKALGLKNTIGLDLFSYSSYIDVGDIHATIYQDDTFDAVLLGWMISYSSNPGLVIDECKRILKPNGFLGIGIESNYEQKISGKIPEGSPRANTLNSSVDLIDISRMKPSFVYDPELNISYDCAVVLQYKTHD